MIWCESLVYFDIMAVQSRFTVSDSCFRDQRRYGIFFFIHLIRRPWFYKRKEHKLWKFCLIRKYTVHARPAYRKMGGEKSSRVPSITSGARHGIRKRNNWFLLQFQWRKQPLHVTEFVLWFQINEGQCCQSEKRTWYYGLHCFCMESIDLSFLCRKSWKGVKNERSRFDVRKGEIFTVGWSLVGRRRYRWQPQDPSLLFCKTFRFWKVENSIIYFRKQRKKGLC